jgi:cytoskeletal protein RodZ
MGKQKSNQSGFGTVEVLLIFVIVVVISFVGWYVFRSKNASTTANTNTTSSSTDSKQKAEIISFDKEKLPVDWTHLTKQDGTLEFDYSGSESAGSSVTLKKTIDTTVRASDEAIFVETHRQTR